MENPEGVSKGHGVVGILEFRGGAKNLELRDRPRGWEPAEFLPIVTEFQVDMGGGGEETKIPQPPRRPLKIMGGLKRVVIPTSTELRS